MVEMESVASGPPPYRPKPLQRHNPYYFEEGNLLLQVRDTLFKVWDGSFRRHSNTFSNIYDLPPTPTAADYDSKGEKMPIYLNDVEVNDFERLLWIIYPPEYGKYKAETPEDWVAVLDLSTRWEFNDIRKLAITQLSAFTIEPIRKIVLEHRYEIFRQWSFEAYVALCGRADALKVEEAKEIGAETTAMIALVRERLGANGRGKVKEVKKVVCEVFDLYDP